MIRVSNRRLFRLFVSFSVAIFMLIGAASAGEAKSEQPNTSGFPSSTHDESPSTEAEQMTVLPKIVNGIPIVDGSKEVPWAISIWYARKKSYTPQAICTGSVIEPNVIVTAAHCLDQDGFYWAEIQAERLGRGNRIPIEALEINSQYRKSTLEEDIALARPLYPIELTAYARLASHRQATRARKSDDPMLILGWGMAGRKRSTQLRVGGSFDASKLAASIWSDFDRRKTIGTLAVRNDKYVAACPGDSGGPLISFNGETPLLIGVISYGGEDCWRGAPTVSTLVPSYRNWIARASRLLPERARMKNRAMPEVVSKATISGELKLGSVLNCSGEMSRNATITYEWSREFSRTKSSGPNVLLTADMANSRISCKITGRGQKGEVASSATVSTPAAPNIFNVGIRGLSSNPVPNDVLTCWAFIQQNGGTDNVEFTWYERENNDSPASLIASGPDLLLSESLLKQLVGRQLLCRAEAFGPFGRAGRGVYTQIKGPSIPYFTVTATNPRENLSGIDRANKTGDVFTCTARPGYSQTPQSASYEWFSSAKFSGVWSGSPLPDDAVLIGTQNTYAINDEVLSDLNLRYLYCKVTLSNWYTSVTQVTRAAYIYR